MFLIAKLRKFEMEKKMRFFIPIALAIAMKICVFAWVQWSMIQNPESFADHEWWRLFVGRWDAGWFNIIARNWYETNPEVPLFMMFAFAPGYPAMVRILGIALGNFTVSQIVISSFFGVLWIPLFQLVAEHYFSKREAFSVILIASFFPSVFLFTSVGYSEGLFITLVLCSWLLYLNGKTISSALVAAGASLTRFFGLFLIVPMLIDSFIRKDMRKAAACTIPILTQIGWVFYGFLKTGNILIYFEASESWIKKYFFKQYVGPAILQTQPEFPFNFPYPEAFAAFEITLLAIFILLIMKTYEIDWRLTVYSICNVLMVVLMGNIGDYVRYLSFVFPIWFVFRTRKILWLIPIIGILGLGDLIYMYLFARWVFL